MANGFVTFLDKLGSDAKKVFTWVGTPAGQTTVVAAEGLGEAAADAVDPALAGLNPIITAWTQEIFKTQALSAAAGAATGSNSQKAAAVANAVVPQIISFAQQNGLTAPAASDVNALNTALVAFLNSFKVAAPAA